MNFFQKTKDRIFFSDNIKNFTYSLDKFLPKLNNTKFYYNKESIKYFLNGNNLPNIKKSFNKSVNLISKNNN